MSHYLEPYCAARDNAIAAVNTTSDNDSNQALVFALAGVAQGLAAIAAAIAESSEPSEPSDT